MCRSAAAARIASSVGIPRPIAGLRAARRRWTPRRRTASVPILAPQLPHRHDARRQRPRLPVQMTVAHPSVSTAGSRRSGTSRERHALDADRQRRRSSRSRATLPAPPRRRATRRKVRKEHVECRPTRADIAAAATRATIARQMTRRTRPRRRGAAGAASRFLPRLREGARSARARSPCQCARLFGHRRPRRDRCAHEHGIRAARRAARRHPRRRRPSRPARSPPSTGLGCVRQRDGLGGARRPQHRRLRGQSRHRVRSPSRPSDRMICAAHGGRERRGAVAMRSAPGVVALGPPLLQTRSRR